MKPREIRRSSRRGHAAFTEGGKEDETFSAVEC